MCASGVVALFAPVRLQQDAIDLIEVDGLGAISDSLDEGAEAEVAYASQQALRRADDQRERLEREGRVRESGAVELGMNEAGEVFRRELGDEDGEGDAALELVVRAERELGEELGLGDEDEVVVLQEAAATPPLTASSPARAGAQPPAARHPSPVCPA